MPEIIHLHWLYNVEGPSGGVAGLRGVTSGSSICGAHKLPRPELTAFVDDVTCQLCLDKAAQPSSPPRLPRERLIKKEIKP